MNYKNIIGKALMMDSERAVKYLGSGAKGAERIKNAAALSGQGHNQMIRARQYQQGAVRAGLGVTMGGGIMATRRKPEPMNPQPTAKGSGRYV
jgi:hypothetical protein